MEMMHELHRTEELLQKSLKELNDKGDLNNQTLDLLGKTLDAVKDLCEIKESENPSYSGMWNAEGSYGRRYGAGRRGMDADNDGRYYEGYGARGGESYGGEGYGRGGEGYGRSGGGYGARGGGYGESRGGGYGEGRGGGYGENRGGGYGNRYGDGSSNQEIIESLRRDLNNASSEQEREYIRNMIRKYEK